MEFEDLDELIEWEARRVAAAFRIQEIVPNWYGVKHNFFGQTPEEVAVTWEIEPPYTQWTCIRVWGNEDCSELGLCEQGWKFSPSEDLDANKVLAYGLYRLGFENEEVWSQLPPLPLTAHEKVELRLSMPHEFWPKKWLDEQA